MASGNLILPAPLSAVNSKAEAPPSVVILTREPSLVPKPNAPSRSLAKLMKAALADDTSELGSVVGPVPLDILPILPPPPPVIRLPLTVNAPLASIPNGTPPIKIVLLLT